MHQPQFAYIRVSTPKQGHGVSLQEQRAAIERYAQKQGLTISRWFEERETAAKRGRPVFTSMLKELRRGAAKGVIIHKIDRSARNLKDWADLGELIDTGVEVHFATESLDLHTRGGRLSADIQAVVAADYIRNLREETRKGFYGRLKQGIYPIRAPIGYLDCGGGKPKEPDPKTAPLVRTAFELYSTGKYSITTLQEELQRLGLRNLRDNRLSRNGISTMLNNPFYIGLIRIRKTNETFKGAHEPIVSPQLFERVQDVLNGRTPHTTTTHGFLFRRLVKCGACGYSLCGERHKGHVYYRCWRSECETNCVREEAIDEAVRDALGKVELRPEEATYLRTAFDEVIDNRKQVEQELRRAIELQLADVKSRTNRLVDAYVDQLIDKSTFEQRKAALMEEEVNLAHKLKELDETPNAIAARLNHCFELIQSPLSTYSSGLPEAKRTLLNELTLNRTVSRKSALITLKFPFDLIANRPKCSFSDPDRDGLRKLAWKIAGMAHCPPLESRPSSM